MNVLDLSQDFSVHTPAFASYDGPSVKWVKRLAFDKAGGQEITIDAARRHPPRRARALLLRRQVHRRPRRSSGWSGRRASSTSSGWGSATTTSTGPSTSSAGRRDTGLTIERGDILIIHTGYHRHYPENWTDLSEVDETKYFIRHPGPTRAFAEWVLERGVRWLAVDAGSADHPMNTVIRRMRADEAEDAEAKLGRPLDDVFPKADYQIMHTLLFPHDVIHIENLGGAIDEVLDQQDPVRLLPVAFPGRRGGVLSRSGLSGHVISQIYFVHFR